MFLLVGLDFGRILTGDYRRRGPALVVRAGRATWLGAGTLVGGHAGVAELADAPGLGPGPFGGGGSSPFARTQPLPVPVVRIATFSLLDH